MSARRDGVCVAAPPGGQVCGPEPRWPKGIEVYSQFTDRAQKTIQYASDEARRLGHAKVGPEHILLGLLREGTGVGANVLKGLAADLATVSQQVERLVLIGPRVAPHAEAGQTAEYKRALAYAMEEAQNLNHNWIGTEHILLGLLREDEWVPARALAGLGLTTERVRSETLLLLGQDVGAVDPTGHKPGLQEVAMYERVSSGDAMRAFMGPHAVDSLIRQAITLCWMMLPDDKKSVPEVESELRRIVDRALTNLKEDARAFGIVEKE
jgi:ATP-dependent Clp protease ATP-binding subunit ClpA